MTATLEISELLDFAVQIEQSGYQFYLEAIKKHPEAEVVSLFQCLADEEFKHQVVFKKIQETLAAAGAGASAGLGNYLKKLFSSHLLADPGALSGLINGRESLVEIIDLALNFEKDSVIFYTELRELVDPENAGVVDRVIREEMRHVQKLVEFKSSLYPG